MSENKPVKSRTIWISLLTSLSYLVAVGGVVNAFPDSQNSRQNITQKIAAIKQTETDSDTETVADEVKAEAEADNTLEQDIISELNRVRTNPQGYADWLENQKQYYQGMLLKLPGEQPIRTNRGLRSLEEAIVFLRQQQELPALSSSTELTSAARQQITAITNNQQVDRNNLVYGKVTPEAIVMQLVVDDGFPDRRHRLAIFNRNHQNTGIACSEIPVYNNVCAIAYRNTEVARQVEDNSEEKNTDLPTPPGVNTPTTSVPEVIITTKPTSQTDIPEEITNNNQTDSNPEPEVRENTTLEEQPEGITQSPSDNNIDSELEVRENTTSEEPEGITQSPSDDNIDSEPEVRENTTSEELESEITQSPSDNNIDSEPEVRENTTSEELESEITQSPPDDNIDSESETTATNETNLDVATSNTNTPSQAVEVIERGRLEEGDGVIPNDGSYYDSYPLEGSAGDSFIITLESEDFDTFLAIMDREGNIIEQNDDVNEQQSNSRLEITLPNDGTYSIIVNAYEQQGRGNYVLRVSR